MLFPHSLPAIALAFLLAALTPGVLLAESVSLHPVADTVLIESAPNANLGGADFFNAGTTGTGLRNHGLMQFALSEAIPAGSIISSVALSLDLVRQPGEGLQTAQFGLYRVFSSWGEGDKTPASHENPGQGAAATAGEANWLYRFLGGPLWNTPGGQPGVDYAAAPSSTALVLQIGDPVEFVTTPELIDDVQAWLDHPDSNHGWMFMPLDEAITRSARSFASRENGTGGPFLTVEFTPVPEPATLSLAGIALMLCACQGWPRRSH